MFRKRWEVGGGKVCAGHDGELLNVSDVLLEVERVENWVVASAVSGMVQE